MPLHGLPKVRAKAKAMDPDFLVIVGSHKLGKTSNLLQLENNLLIDLEGAAERYGGLYESVPGLIKEAAEEAKEKKKKPTIATRVDAIRHILKMLKKSDQVYDFITIDTSTELEDIAKELGLLMYKATPQGQEYEGDDILMLAHGAGYMWLNKALDMLFGEFKKFANHCLIVTAHVKLSSMSKSGEEIAHRDIQMTGKSKLNLCRTASAIGYMFRKDGENVNVLSFQRGENDLVTGTWCEHLAGQEFILSTYDNETKELQTHWEKIFPEYFKNKK